MRITKVFTLRVVMMNRFHVISSAQCLTHTENTLFFFPLVDSIHQVSHFYLFLFVIRPKLFFVVVVVDLN